MVKEFDIILWGATGYTGKLALKYLFNRYGTTVRFAVAGRSVEKLEALISELQVSVKVPLLEASLGDEASLRNVAASCKAIIACVGPFRLYGEPLMKACIAEKTHYVDITGETDWIKKMDQKYSEQAKSQGVALMPFCAFEAASTEMGLIQLFSEAENIEQWGFGFDLTQRGCTIRRQSHPDLPHYRRHLLFIRHDEDYRFHCGYGSR